MKHFKNTLSGGDLRSIGNSNIVVSEVRNQADFDALFKLLFQGDRIVVMRAADAIEKITIDHPEYLSDYTRQVFGLCNTAVNKELRWHLALLIPRLNLNKADKVKAGSILNYWLNDKSNSNIVRVNALQGLFALGNDPSCLNSIFEDLEQEHIPSISARIRRLKSKL